MNLETGLTLAGVIVAIAAIGIPLFVTLRRNTKEDTRQAITDATAPLIDERDYLRTQLRDAQRRIEELEDQLRSRDDRA